MKKYLKMDKFFVGKVSCRFAHGGDVVIDYDCADPDMMVIKTMDAIEHSINSHDELVQINQELLEALEFVMSAHGEQLDTAFAQAQGVISKAKGGSE